MFEVGVARTFHALHQLEEDVGAEPHEHEHDYRVEAVVRGEGLADSGMLLDLDVLGALLTDCLIELDSTDLDSLATFADQNTTVEVVAQHIWRHVREGLEGSASLHSLRITVYESAAAWASIDGPLAD
ncbi:MAG: 6-carboxytetrahydropterin synthase [Chloroflexota bacterium]|nr:6-carboxytetrahydropterin synthase [Chloroflexota bacterium]